MVNKYTKGKIRYDLIDPQCEEGLACALTNGISKYRPYSWQKVKPEDYVGALRRHLAEHRRAMLNKDTAQYFDDKSKLLHLDHAMACIMFLRWSVMQDPVIRKTFEATLNNKSFMEPVKEDNENSNI